MCLAQGPQHSDALITLMTEPLFFGIMLVGIIKRLESKKVSQKMNFFIAYGMCLWHLI